MNNLVAKQLGPYQITLRIGDTATTEIYKAYDEKLGRYITLQTILPRFTQNLDLVNKIKAHARVLASLQHINIARLLDCDIFDGVLCLVYDVVPKNTLKRPLQKTYQWNQAIQLLLPIAQALAYAHQNKVLHQAISPSSILVSQEGALYLFDIGLQHILFEFSVQDNPGLWLGGGKAGYMSSRQILGKDPSYSDDIYSFFVVLLELIIGNRPFLQQNNPINEIQLQIRSLNSPPKIKLEQIPEAIRYLLEKGLSPVPNQQFKSMLEVSVLFTRIALGQKISKSMVRKPLRTIRPPLKPGTIRAGVIAAIFIVLLVFGFIAREPLSHWVAQFNPTPEATPVSLVPMEATVSPRETASITPTNESVGSPDVSTEAPGVGEQKIDALPVLENTPVPTPSSRISVSNARRVVNFARWGIGKVNNAQLSPDGMLMALSTTNGIYLVRLEDGEIATFINTGTWVNSSSFSPDSTMILSSENDGLLRMWTLNGEEGLTMSGHLGAINEAIFSPDGKFIASASDDRTTKIWDATSGVLLRTLETHVQPVQSLAFSPDGRYLLSGGRDFSLLMWDYQSGELIREKNTRGKVMDITFWPQGNQVALAEDNGNIEIYHLEEDTFKAVLVGLSAPATSVSIDSTGTFILAADGAGKIIAWGQDQSRVWNNSLVRVNRILSSDTTYAQSVFFLPNKTSFIAANWDGTLRTWSTEDWTETSTFPDYSHYVEEIVYSNKRNLVAIQTADGLITVYSLNGEMLYQIEGKLVSKKAFSKQDEYFAFMSNPTTITVVDAYDGDVLFVFGGHSVIRDTVFSNDSLLMAAGVSSDIHLWSLTSGQQIDTRSTISVKGCTNANNWLEQGIAYSTTYHFLDFVTSRKPELICDTQRIGWMSEFEIQQNGTNIVAGGTSKVQVWDYLKASSSAVDMQGVTGLTVTSLAITSDGTLIAAALNDLTIRIWNAETGIELIRLYGHNQRINGLAFSPDTNYLVSGSLDGTVRIWGID